MPDGQRIPVRTGRFPKNYTRSDDRIRDEICDRLGQTYDLDPSDVEVKVDGGVVMLSGSVPERWMRYQIEHVCDGVAGVRDVQNDIVMSTSNSTEK